MIRTACTFLFVLFSLTSRAGDTISFISGRVTVRQSGEPLPGASIIYGKSRGTISSPDGFFFIRTQPGNILLIVKYLGYVPQTLALRIEPGDTSFIRVEMEPELNEIDQIVVSADRNEQKLSESTVSLSIIRPGLLAERHINDAEELINKTPGIEVLDGQASIRGGSGFSYGAGSRVLALIDGLPVISADAGNIKWQFLPLENLSQVEIIKGAASVLYGSSALNGIINFRTAPAGPEPLTVVNIESGFYDRPARLEWKWWDHPRVFGSVTISSLRKIRNNDLAFSAGFFNDQGYRRLNDEVLGRFSFSFKQYHQKIKGLEYGINVHSGKTLKRDFLLWENAKTGALRQDPETTLQLHGDFIAMDPFLSFKKSSSFTHELRSRVQIHDNFFPERKMNNSSAYSVYTEYLVRVNISELISLNSGLTENISRVTSNFYGDHTGVNLSALTQLEIKPVPELKFLAGIRLEYNRLDGSNDRVVPVFRSGLNYRLGEYTFLRASFGQGYRYPSVAEKHASTSLGSVRIFPNPYIKAETGWNSEAGIRQGIRLGPWKGQADLAVFYSRNTEMIEYLFGLYENPADGNYDFGFKAGNVEQSRVYGSEVEFMLNGDHGILNSRITGGYIFMVPAEFNEFTGKNTGQFLKYRRKHSGKLSLNTGYKRSGLGVDFYAKSPLLAIDDVFLNEMTREDILPGFYEYWTLNNKAYFLIDAGIYREFGKLWTLSLSLRNLTNTEYMGRPGDIRPPRSFSLKATCRL